MKTKEFKDFIRRTERDYLGKPVPYKYRKEFGLKFNKKDIIPFAYLIAKSRGIQTEKFISGIRR